MKIYNSTYYATEDVKRMLDAVLEKVATMAKQECMNMPSLTAAIVGYSSGVCMTASFKTDLHEEGKSFQLGINLPTRANLLLPELQVLASAGGGDVYLPSERRVDVVEGMLMAVLQAFTWYNRRKLEAHLASTSRGDWLSATLPLRLRKRSDPTERKEAAVYRQEMRVAWLDRKRDEWERKSVWHDSRAKYEHKKSLEYAERSENAKKKMETMKGGNNA